MYVCVYVCVGGGGGGRAGGRDIQTLAKLSIGEGGCDKKVMQREIQEGDFKITCNARWTLSHTTQDGRSFTVPRTFNFCLKWGCVSSTIPKGSTITKPPEVFRVDQNAQITPDEWQVITFMKLPLLFD